MAKKQDPVVAHLLDLLSSLGNVRSRAMFGGHGIYCDDFFFALVADGALYLKADEENQPLFEEAGCEPFLYHRQGRKEPIQMSYWEAPPETIDRADLLLPWAQHALAAARRAKEKKRC